jgi:hypothetical protein
MFELYLAALAEFIIFRLWVPGSPRRDNKDLHTQTSSKPKRHPSVKS